MSELPPPGPHPWRRLWCSLLPAVALVAACSRPAEKPVPRLGRVNVVVVLVDALRADRLGVYGSPGRTTPHLDALARNALVYADASSPASWTSPSCASLFTATVPAVHGIVRPPDEPLFSVLPPSFVLPAEVLREHGYASGMITTIGWVSPKAGFDQGVGFHKQTRRSDRALIQNAKAFVSEHRDRPFHLYLHLIDLHDYFWPQNLFAGRRERRLHPASPLLGLLEATPSEVYSALTSRLHRRGRLSRRDLRFLLDAYDWQLRETDRHIGQLVAHLEREGLLDSTVIVVTSDHGEQFLEHDNLGHGGTRFLREVLHVPLLIAAPGRFREQRTIGTPVSLVDVYPTLFELLSIPVPPEFDGRAVLGPEPDRIVYATDGQGTWRAHSSGWSYVVAPPDREELYRLATDPRELRNLAGLREGAAALGSMRSALAAYRQRCAGHVYRKAAEAAAEVAMDEQDLEAIRAMGYIE